MYRFRYHLSFAFAFLVDYFEHPSSSRVESVKFWISGFGDGFHVVPWAESLDLFLIFCREFLPFVGYQTIFQVSGIDSLFLISSWCLILRCQHFWVLVHLVPRQYPERFVGYLFRFSRWRGQKVVCNIFSGSALKLWTFMNSLVIVYRCFDQNQIHLVSQDSALGSTSLAFWAGDTQLLLQTLEMEV